MRKRLVAGLIILCMCLCSCGKKEEGIEQETEEQEEVITEGIGNGGAESGATTAEAVEIVDPWESGRTDALSPDELPVLETGMLSDCITLCRIDGLKVHVMLKDDPNEEDAVTYARLLKDAKPLLDAGSGIRPGDVVNIDMYALKEEDEEFTKRGVSISVGSGTGPEELEEALIGMCKNEEKKVTVSYPEDYLYMGLNGRTVEYKVIVNSTPIIGLANIGKLDLLRLVYQKITIPQAVFDELISPSVRQQVLKNRDWIQVEHIQDASQKQMYRAKLHAGEVEVMILAQEKKADLVLLDDNAAKKTAKYLGLPVTGTLGLLLRAKREGYIDAVIPVMDALEKDGFFIRDSVRQMVTEQAGE